MNLWRKLFITNNFPYKFIEIFLWLNNSKEAIMDDSQYCLIDSINRNRGKEWPIGIESWLFTVLIFYTQFGKSPKIIDQNWKLKGNLSSIFLRLSTIVLFSPKSAYSAILSGFSHLYIMLKVLIYMCTWRSWMVEVSCS